MSRSEKIRQAIKDDNLTTYRGRFVGTPMQLSYLADTAYSTIKNAYGKCKVQTYVPAGAGILVDAIDLADYFDNAKRGRPPKVI